MTHYRHARLPRSSRFGFTVVELLVVIGIMVLLVAILVPALFAATGAGVRAQSVNHLRQIAQWMQLYSQDNTQHIVPSQFNYTGSTFPGKVKSETPNPNQSVGTWTDILWTGYVDEFVFPQMRSIAGHDYQFDSPDSLLYDNVPDFEQNPLRSTMENTLGNEKRFPGYFAANDFFNADQSNIANFNGWWTMPQIAKPDSSLYVIDSFRGETIADAPAPFDFNNLTTRAVDFRYEGEALMLFLDGHVSGAGVFQDLNELQTGRRVKVLDLDER